MKRYGVRPSVRLSVPQLQPFDRYLERRGKQD